MTVAAPPLAGDARGCWVYGPGPRRPQDREKTRTPVGALLNHGDHMMLVVWGVEPANAVLETLDPLTLGGALTCPTCHAEFKVNGGLVRPNGQEG